MKTLLSIITIVGFISASCSQTEQKTEISANEITDESMDPGVEFADSLVQYMALKNALVASDALAAKDAANSLMEDLRHEALLPLVQSISASEDLEQQREFFSDLSEQWINTLKDSEVRGTVYVQYCPMAFDNTGASWLSLSEEIENPYFGDQMLHCGTLENEL